MGRLGTSIVLLLCLAACVLAQHDLEPPNIFDLPLEARPHLKVLPAPLHDHVGRNSSKRAAIQGLNCKQLLAVYGLTYNANAGAGKIIGIVDAFSCPTCQNDMNQFTSYSGIASCNTPACFTKMSQTGSTTSFPAEDTTSNWGFEAAMDIQAAHCVAPAAKKLLIVSNSASFNDLLAGVQQAVTQGANVVSMSWGGGEFSGQNSFDSYFSKLIGYFASTGDNGASGGIEYPSSSSRVIAVGGTSLYTNPDKTFSSEAAWSGSGGGCSAYTTALTQQSSRSDYAANGCNGKKVLPDTSLNADPNSGLIIYYSGKNNGSPACTVPNCYFYGGGTSLAAPLLAARAAVRGILSDPSNVYNSGLSFRDITSGSNGNTATTGLDKATGVGSLLN